MRRFVIVGRHALASPDFLLDDLPGTSGRLDVLLRSVRAALLVSHGIRAGARVYLVLLGGPRAPRTLRFDSATAKFFRPDERSLATLARKVLAHDSASERFVEIKPGVALAAAGLAAVDEEIGAAPLVVLREDATDVRTAELPNGAVFVVGDHLGFDAATEAWIAGRGALAVSLGPVSLHTDDAIAVLSNELDRRAL